MSVAHPVLIDYFIKTVVYTSSSSELYFGGTAGEVFGGNKKFV